MASFSWQLRIATLTVLGVMAAGAALAQAVGPEAALQQKLNQSFKATVVSGDRSEIVTAGSIVSLQKGGLLMYAVSSPMPPENSYKNGKISQGWGKLGRDFGITLRSTDGNIAANYPQRKLTVGENVWVNQVVVQNDHVSFVLYSDPDDSGVRYYGELKFPFGKGPMPAPDDVVKTIGEVLVAQAQDSVAATPATLQAPPAQMAPPTPAAMAPIAPPPPPADLPAAQPPTINVGDTRDQVTAAFGQPQKVVKLQTKEIDYYPDMKVTYVNGKVSTVQ